MPGEKLVRVNCATCKTDFAIPKQLHTACHHSEKISFKCPYGHSNIYREGLSDAEKQRLRADRALQESARLRDERDVAIRRTAAAKGQVTKLKNRAKAGVCPCCTRHFTNLERHMKSKHPDKKEVAA